MCIGCFFNKRDMFTVAGLSLCGACHDGGACATCGTPTHLHAGNCEADGWQDGEFRCASCLRDLGDGCDYASDPGDEDVASVGSGDMSDHASDSGDEDVSDHASDSGDEDVNDRVGDYVDDDGDLQPPSSTGWARGSHYSE